jgi:Bifunctional DNA primase/polymerase, N-terminal/Primase C terminal 1 (PriCT-1)
MNRSEQIHAHTHTLDMESLILKEAGFSGKVRDIIDAIIGAAGARVSPIVFELDHYTLARRLNHPQAHGGKVEKRDKKAAITYVSRKLKRLEHEMKKTGKMIIRIVHGHEEQRTKYEVFLTPVANSAYQRAWDSELWKEHPGKAKSAQVAQALAELPPYIAEEAGQEAKGECDEKMIKRNDSTILSLAAKSFEADTRTGRSPKEHYEELMERLRGLAELAEQKAKGKVRRYVIKHTDNPTPERPEGGVYKSVDTPSEPPNLQAALAYAARGWPVFPTKPDKSPYTVRGFKSATCNPAIIRGWYLRHPDAGIGVPMGGASQLFALDFDNRHGGADALAKLEAEGLLPPTLTHETGDGCHKIFEYSKHMKLTNARGALPTGVDVRVNGYIIMPPSLHPSGKRYKVLNDLPPAWPPPKLLEMLTAEKSKVAVAPEMKPLPEPKNGAGIGPVITDGNRNATLFRIASAERGRGECEDTILQILIDVNARRCVPPLEEKELEKIARSAMRYAPNAAAVA